MPTEAAAGSPPPAAASSTPPAPAAAPDGQQAAGAQGEQQQTPPAAPPKKKTGKARHEEIRQLLKGAAKADAPAADGDKPPVAAAAPAAGDKPAEPKPGDKKPDEAKPKQSVGAVMRLTSENTKLTNRVAELEAQVATHKTSSGESIDTLRARVKKNPAVLFEVFGKDIEGADDRARLAKFNDHVLASFDPATAAERERDERLAALERERDEERAENERLKSSDRDTRARAHTAQVLTEGVKGDDGAFIIDPAKYPYVNHLTKTGEVDAHRGVMFATRELAKEFRAEQKREPTDTELVTMIGVAAETAETHFAKRAKNWSLSSAAPPPAAAAAPAPATPPVRRTPNTIGSGMGSGSPAAGAPDGRKLSKSERHEAIRERLRRANQQAAPN